MITLQQLHTKAELKNFVEFPFTLYKNCDQWVPNIINNEVEEFDVSKNPVFKHAEAHFFLAYKNNIAVGRVAAIINHKEINEQGIKKVRFGWLDFIDDIEVSKTLLEKVATIGRNYTLSYMEGPMGFSNMDKVGALTYGYEHPNGMGTWYNFPYYITHFEALGFTIEKEYLENLMLFKNIHRPTFEPFSIKVKERYNLRALSFTTTKEVMPMVDEMFDLFNSSYASLSSFVAISEDQKQYFKQKYISFINPEYIQFVMNQANEMVAFAIVMPSFTKALKKANGSLWPFGAFHMLWAKYFHKEVNFYLIGVRPDYQKRGVHSIIFTEYHKIFEKKGIKTCTRTPELADNTAIAAIWKDFQPKIFHKRCTFKKQL